MPDEVVDQGPEGTVENSENAQGQPGTSSGKDQIAEKLTPVSSDVPEHIANILKDFSPEDRAKFAPKVQEWDANTSKKFAEYANSLKAYEGIDPVAAKAAIELEGLLNSNPAKAIEILQARLSNNPAPVEDVQTDDDDFDYNLLPKIIRDKLDMADKIPQLQQIVEKLAQERIDFENHRQLEQQKVEYNAHLDTLTEKHGAFDRDWVTKAVALGTDPEEAVQKFQATVKSYAEEQLKEHNNAPNVLGGSSVVPSEPVNLAKLSSKETAKLVTQMLIEANKANS